MFLRRLSQAFAASLVLLPSTSLHADPVRVLFLGHESKHHNSNLYYPMLAKALGPHAIYFDYVTDVERALGDAEYLAKFDAVLLYANHNHLLPRQWKNLNEYVLNGGGFVPLHSASACFGNESAFDRLVGGRFNSHGTGVFAARVIEPDHPAMNGVEPFEAWDETYVHRNHNTQNRTVLMVRDPMPGDPHSQPEPWTWVRTHGKGRIFYTASGHDEQTWGHPSYHKLVKAGILWTIGDDAKARWQSFINSRTPLAYEKRDNVPNYERREQPLLYQHPLSPADSMKYTQVPIGFRLELFASEPDIVNPIYMQWDEAGRLWVCESVDYPNELTSDRKGNDRIKICEDTNGDGKADKFTVFADGLNVPTSFTFAKGGIIVAHAPRFLFLKDTDGDDKADLKEIVFDGGWGVGDTHAGPSNLRYGFDNWIWGTVGYARFNGRVNDKQHNFGMGVFRFKADGSDIEFLHQFNNNTWGLGFDADGEVFGSTANNNPSFFGGLPASVFSGQSKTSAKMIADSPAFHPITPNIRQVDAFGNYTAACGHALATSAAFPLHYRDRMAFVCGPTGHLLGMYQTIPDGSGYRSKNAFAFVASADEWFSPIVAEVGPDGHLWVADWYNFIIQHNPTPSKGRGGYDAKRGVGNAHVNPNRDRQHGRIYRVVWEHAAKSPITSLANATTDQLVAALSSDNLFWRSTAQRLLVDGGHSGAVPMLRQLAKGVSPSAIHALWTLHGLNALDSQSHLAALNATDLAVKRNAIRALGTDEQSIQMFFDSAVVAHPDPSVRRVAFGKLAAFPESETRTLAANELMKNQDNLSDEWLVAALKAAGAGSVDVERWEVGPNLVANPSFEDATGDKPNGWSVRNYRGALAKTEHVIETREAYVRTGKHSVRISSSVGHDTSLNTRVTLKPNARYRVSGWVKTQGVKGAMGALFNVHEYQANGRTTSVRGDKDWTKVEVTFESNTRTQVTLNALFGGWGVSTGTAWYDDVSVNELIPVYKERGQTQAVKGDVVRGKKIFDEHQVAACIRCHVVGGKGGPIGPVLDGIAARKSRDYILESLVNPAATLAEGFEKLGASPMPPMQILLKPQELADVMAYVMTLK